MESKLRKKNLEQVKMVIEKISDIEPKIEPKIRDLVIGFQIWSFTTIMSCEGDLNGLPYPWLTIPFKYVKEAARILCEWNYCQGPTNPINPVIWIIDPTAEPRIRPLTEKHSLKALQDDAIRFGRWLQNLPEDFDRWSKD